jgi:hypothetical protein
VSDKEMLDLFAGTDNFIDISNDELREVYQEIAKGKHNALLISKLFHTAYLSGYMDASAKIQMQAKSQVEWAKDMQGITAKLFSTVKAETK